MKKTVFALAALAPFAFAQAQSSVTVYGLVDAGISFGDGGGSTGRTTRLDSGIGPGSRWGLKGTEDLGEGLSASFTLESGFDSGTGASQQGGLLFGRQGFFGISSNKGWSLTMGRQLSPSNLAMAAADAMGQTHWGSTSGSGLGTLQSPGAASVQGSGCQGATTRINNSVMGTMSGNGFTGRLLIGMGDENSRGTGKVVNPSITYASGPLTLAAAYTRIRQCAPDIAATADPDWQSEVVLGGAYKLGAASLFAGYYNFDPSEANKVVGPTTLLNHKMFWLGAQVPVSSVGTIKAQISQLKQEFTGDDGKGTAIGVTYTHSLSKRTTAYVSTAYLKNNDQAKFGLVGATAVQAADGLGLNPRVLSFGVTHSF